MGTRHLLIRAAAAAILSLAPTRADAQDVVEITGGWGRWYGDNAAGFDGGSLLGAAYLADLGWPVLVGLDTRFARFGYDLGVPLDLEVDEFQAALVAHRWLRGADARVRPFLAARLGYTRLALDVAEFRFEQNGVLAGPTLGVQLPTGRTLSPAFAFEMLHYRYGDTRLFLEDGSLPQSGGGAWRLQARVSLTFRAARRRR